MSNEAMHPCTQVGCTSVEGIVCAYVDRRGRQCRTAWCPVHRVTMEGRVYCRRHAGVVSVLPTGDPSMAAPFPDLDNRAPSLVGWVSRQLDQDVWNLMLRELAAEAGAQLLADPIALVFLGINRQRAWERAWKLDSYTGISRRASIMVAEDDDTEVIVKVGANIVDRLVPPWIEHRVRGQTTDPESDRREREAFNQRVLDAIERGLAREREVTEYISHGRTADHPLHVTGEPGVTKP
jgi:hypothetical protein